jgi:Fe2+ or Zn2+ uptake regulation protein
MLNEQLNEVLQDMGLRSTPQRITVLTFLAEYQGHPTAEEVMAGVKGKLPKDMSRATVYKILHTLVKGKLLKETSVKPGVTRYDLNQNEHHHFVDRRTGEIIDIPWQMVGELQDTMPRIFKVGRYQITFYGDIVAPEKPCDP